MDCTVAASISFLMIHLWNGEQLLFCFMIFCFHVLVLFIVFSLLCSLKNSDVDKDGVRYMLLCRVMLGKVEAVHPGSDQSHPSSTEFDSGVDNLKVPKRYIVWTSNMNTHILPEYIISLKAPSSLKGKEFFFFWKNF